MTALVVLSIEGFDLIVIYGDNRRLFVTNRSFVQRVYSYHVSLHDSHQIRTVRVK